ncbi:hypothetical protein [Blastomonas aquatica]|uniref:Uncharacterized protein n=1 Tax=Blastomonas aquatica TaxID=1510276 RepID=A0ABQ1JNX8_9SPHN|nr:hypothetical protein [Blastomonas aquatica]GGB73119.1 hypothetical protein GCM10010833_30400 [Blastomonas aquatica]
MIRWFSLAAFGALLALGWVIFELANAWPINADKIPGLRAMFAVFSLLATGAFLFVRWRLLPAALLLTAFVLIAALSNAVLTIPYLASAAVVVLMVAVLSRLFGPPLNVS